jgi:hypothetical protein
VKGENMRKIVLDTNPEEVKLSDVDRLNPIFAKENGKFIGMVVKEEKGWVLRIGHSRGWNGFHPTLVELIESCDRYGFFTE